MTARSYLFVPGDRADMLAKAGERGADAIIVDLEDAVAPVAKALAREAAATWMAGLNDPAFEVWVRINATPALVDADLGIAGSAALTGLMVPKIETADDVTELSMRLTQIERHAGMDSGKIRLLPIVETPRAMRALDVVAASPRVHQLMIGELDLGAAIGVDPTNIEAFLPLRMALVVASAAAGINAPLGPVSPDYTDLEGFAADTVRLVRLGFGSRPAIHPAQVPVINAAFTPGADEVARARRVIALYEAALAEGAGSIADEDGNMVDEAVVQVARRLLDRAGPGGGNA